MKTTPSCDQVEEVALYFFSSYLYGDLRADIMMQLICFPEGTSRNHDFNTVVYIASQSRAYKRVWGSIEFPVPLISGIVAFKKFKCSRCPYYVYWLGICIPAAGAPVYRIPSLERLSICNIMAAPCYYISSRHAVRTKNVDLHMKFTWNRKEQKRENGMDNEKRTRLDYWFPFVIFGVGKANQMECNSSSTEMKRYITQVRRFATHTQDP